MTGVACGADIELLKGNCTRRELDGSNHKSSPKPLEPPVGYGPINCLDVQGRDECFAAGQPLRNPRRLFEPVAVTNPPPMIQSTSALFASVVATVLTTVVFLS